MTLTLPEWADVVFGLADPDDYMRLSRLDGICEPDLPTLQRLIELFENPASILRPYDDRRVDQGFWDLGSSAFRVLYELGIDWTLRHRFVRSFEVLFRELYAARCSPVLSHLSEQGTRLNISCYMWFDFDCWCAMPDPLTRNPIDAALIQSMESILGIGHVACQEGALHGLGHWHHAHPRETETIIDEFLARERSVPEPLRQYALGARQGCVL